MRALACVSVFALGLGMTSAIAGEDRKAPELSDIKVKPMERSPNKGDLNRLPWNLADLNVEKAWVRSKGNVRVCLVDTGVDVKNAELGSRIQAGYNALAKNTDYSDSDGQGTGVAGVIVSVAPEAKLYVAKAADSSSDPDSLSPSAVASGILWCAEQNVLLINVSLAVGPAAARRDVGGAVEKAIKSAQTKGALVITAAGANNVIARYRDVVVVSASGFRGAPAKADADPQAAFFAPGVGVMTMGLGGRDAARSGAAFAAPHVAGLAALYAAVHPEADPLAIRSALTRAIRRVWLPEAEQRDGRVDAARLVNDHEDH